MGIHIGVPAVLKRAAHEVNKVASVVEHPVRAAQQAGSAAVHDAFELANKGFKQLTSAKDKHLVRRELELAKIAADPKLPKPARVAAQVEMRKMMGAEPLATLDPLPFPDHHAFDARDVARIVRSGERRAGVICTLKDAVKLTSLWPPAGPSLPSSCSNWRAWRWRSWTTPSLEPLPRSRRAAAAASGISCPIQWVRAMQWLAASRLAWMNSSGVEMSVMRM